MKLAFITDNGFYEESGKLFFSTANLQHVNTVNNHFKEITIVAQRTAYDGTELTLPKHNKLTLLNSRRKVDLLKIEAAVKEADIVISFGFNGIISQHYAKKFNKQSIFYVGGCYYDTWRNVGSKPKRFLAPLLKLVFKNAISKADYVQYVDEYLIERYPSKKDAQVLVCPSARIQVPDEYLKGRLEKIQNNVFKLGIIGYTHNKIKGIDTAIKAIAHSKSDVILEIVGRGDTNYLKSLAKELGVEKQVIFLGSISNRDELFDWLKSLDLYLQPSLTEGMPRATLEAMSTACPVISTSAGGLQSLVPIEQRINVGDYKAMANKIDLILNDEKLYKKIVLATFNKAKEYSFEKLDERRDTFYKQVVRNIERDMEEIK